MESGGRALQREVQQARQAGLGCRTQKQALHGVLGKRRSPLRLGGGRGRAGGQVGSMEPLGAQDKRARPDELPGCRMTAKQIHQHCKKAGAGLGNRQGLF